MTWTKLTAFDFPLSSKPVDVKDKSGRQGQGVFLPEIGWLTNICDDVTHWKPINKIY